MTDTRSPQNASTSPHSLEDIIAALPDTPGCYQYLNSEGVIIYVGKAKRLKRRIASYFNKEQQSAKTRLLVSKIADIKYIVVPTEADALLLENNLIKKHQPRYNVLLKDDKTYPSICVTHEPFPRIFYTRNRGFKHCTYYGPYSHLPTMRALLDICQRIYKPRTCRLPLSKESIASGRYKVCLDYHIKRCEGACIGAQSQEDYQKAIEACTHILRGNTSEVSKQLVREMKDLAAQMRFEEAQKLKERYELIEQFRSKSEVVSNTLHNIDVFAIDTEGTAAYINYLHVRQGCITQAFTFEYKKRLDETPEELLTLGIIEMRTRYKSTAREILTSHPIDLPLDGVQVATPQRGDKRKLLDLSLLNVKQYKFDRLKQAEKLNPEQKSVRLMKEIQEALGLPHLPLRIELFDNSNISGSNAVAACVVFDKLKPAKAHYRRYTIRSVVGPDDYASMREVVMRRYRRIIDEGGTLPNLIIADGGKGQMEVIRQVVEDELRLDIPIAGLAKNDKHRTRELLYGFPTRTIGLRPEAPLFRLLTQMQDEVHRYAISFHRDKRSKRQVASALDHVAGIGPTTKQALLKHFGSVKRIMEAPTEDLQTLLGKTRGAKIYQALHASASDTPTTHANHTPEATQE